MKKPQSEIRNEKSRFPKGGFSFIEVMTTLGIFFLLASVGLGAYFQYYKFSLINNDIHSAQTLIRNTRFKALKNPTGSNYGVHIDEATNEITSFEGSYVHGESSNIVVQLEQVTITNLNLMPTPGVTDQIIFQAGTAKTQNTGSFSVGSVNYSYTLTINAEGAID